MDRVLLVTDTNYIPRGLGRAETARELPGGCALNPEYRPAYEQDVATVRAGLTEEAFTAAWQRGRAMSLSKPRLMLWEDNQDVSPAGLLTT